MIKIKKNKVPLLNRSSFLCDSKIHDKLDNVDIYKLMNKSHFACFIGLPGAGKSSMAISFLNSHQGFKRCFHNIILFCPSNSRASIKDDFWGANLDESNIYDDLTLEDLQNVYEMCMEEATTNYKTLIVFDDVQKQMKGECEKYILHMINNRRHAKLSMWFLCQNYKSIPLQIRTKITDLFLIGKMNKSELNNIFEEQIDIDKLQFEKILKLVFKNSHDFVYLNHSYNKIFSNFDELIIE